MNSIYESDSSLKAIWNLIFLLFLVFLFVTWTILAHFHCNFYLQLYLGKLFVWYSIITSDTNDMLYSPIGMITLGDSYSIFIKSFVLRVLFNINYCGSFPFLQMILRHRLYEVDVFFRMIKRIINFNQNARKCCAIEKFQKYLFFFNCSAMKRRKWIVLWSMYNTDISSTATYTSLVIVSHL